MGVVKRVCCLREELGLRDYKRRLMVGLIFAVPVVVLDMEASPRTDCACDGPCLFAITLPCLWCVWGSFF